MRVLIAVDACSVREWLDAGVRACLPQASVGVAAHRVEGVIALIREPPDVLLVALSLRDDGPGPLSEEAGLALISAAARLPRRPWIISLCAEELHGEALSAGADVCLACAPELTWADLRSALTGRGPTPRQLSQGARGYGS